MTEQTGSRAYRCLMCDGIPAWRLERHGDGVVTWACATHLQIVADDLLENRRAGARLMLRRFGAAL